MAGVHKGGVNQGGDLAPGNHKLWQARFWFREGATFFLCTLELQGMLWLGLALGHGTS